MNIGMVVHRYDPGEGTGGYVVRLLPHLAAAHGVTLYAAAIRAPVPDGVEVVKVPALMWRAYTAILSFPAAFRAVRRRHDLVHAQGWVSSGADVVTAHIVLAAWRQAARVARVPTPPGERWLGGFVQAREGTLMRNATRVIAPSALAKAQIAAHYGRREGVTVVPHGFPDTRPRRESLETLRRRFGLPTGVPLALYAGDIRKGLAPALDGVAAVPEWHLCIASRSPLASDALLARHERLRDRVRLLGRVDDIASLYEAVDLLLHPTICDSFGLVVAEAMACGTPAVVTPQAGISELIRHGDSGWIAGTPTADAVKHALEALRDVGLRHKLGEGARAVAARHTWENAARATLAVYEAAARR
jgi:glycosyltransferase involved in cell wall biosynthesis